MIERCKDHTVAHGNLELVERMVCRLEVGGHATADFAVLLQAAAERNTLKVAFQVIGPLVIGAEEFLAIPETLPAELGTAVGADVLDAGYRSIRVPGDDDGAFADGCALEIAGIGNFGFEADIVPMLGIENAVEFPLVNFRVGVGPERYPAGPFPAPQRHFDVCL